MHVRLKVFFDKLCYRQRGVVDINQKNKDEYVAEEFDRAASSYDESRGE